MKQSAKLLNIYINSGGRKSSYEEIQKACQDERWAAKKLELKKTPLLWIITIPLTYIWQKLDKLIDDSI